MAWSKPRKVTVTQETINNYTSTYIDPLKGKRIAVLGSSSADSNRPHDIYWEQIAKRTGAVILDYADSGSRLTSDVEEYSDATDNPENSINQLKRLDDLFANVGTNLDIIVSQPAANDENNLLTKGTFTDRTATTVYGAMHLLCLSLYEKYPTQPKGILTSQYMNPRIGQFSAYQDIVKEVCAYYSIPVCDLRAEGNVPYVIDTWRSAYAPDNTHLNEQGDTIMSRRVESFVRMLIGQ